MSEREAFIAVLSVLVAVLGLWFTAFYIWLVVRIINRQERWAKRLAMSLATLLVGWALSSAPIAGLEMRGVLPHSLKPAIEFVYLPIWLALNFGPQWMRSPIIAYLRFWGAW
jgi:hypothetical protein